MENKQTTPESGSLRVDFSHRFSSGANGGLDANELYETICLMIDRALGTLHVHTVMYEYGREPPPVDKKHMAWAMYALTAEIEDIRAAVETLGVAIDNAKTVE
jgi:hypothetical protein